MPFFSYPLSRQLLATFFILIASTLSAGNAIAAVKSYHFTIDMITVKKSGKATVPAMGINGQIPAPLIEAELGDTLEVTFTNNMPVVTSVHWHGILLPADQDGVPFLNTKPIGPGETFTFRFDIKHTGTYWYHSHTGLQEQRGLYGPIRLLPKNNKSQTGVSADIPLVWSDWSDENPKDILRNLKRDGDYYALKKDAVQSWDKVLMRGKAAIKARLSGAMNRMGPMDLSDVGYDAFLANGERIHTLADAPPGSTVLLRMINASASTYLNVEYAGGEMTIIEADGMPVEPLKVQRLQIAVAETYNVLVKVPLSGAAEIRATANDGTGYASAMLGKGAIKRAPDIPRPDLFVADHSMHDMPNHDMPNHDMDAVEHCAMGHEMPGMTCPANPASQSVIAHMTDYSALRAPEPTKLSGQRPVRNITLTLTGDMERYVWSFDNKTLSEADRILINKGERVRFHFVNETMMNHPFHLHGHFFRVLNGQGDYSPLKHTFDLPGMSSATIEFAADEEADWIFHCHNLYHMKSGMSRVMSYKGTSKATDAFVRSLSADDDWFTYADVAAASNQWGVDVWTKNNRFEISAMASGGWDDDKKLEFEVSRTIDRYSAVFIGAEHEDMKSDKESFAFVGAHLVLPLLMEASIQIDTNGHVKAGLESALQLTDKGRFSWDVDTDKDYDLTYSYALSKRWAFFATKNSDWGSGVGLKASF